MVTLDDIRSELEPRWEHALPLVDLIEQRMDEDSRYRLEVNLWLSGEKSTVHLRNFIAAPLRDHFEVVEIGQRFRPTTQWDNTWMPLDTAAHLARQRKLEPNLTEPEFDADFRALPHFGMF